MDRCVDVGIFGRALQDRLGNANCSANGGGSCVKTRGLEGLKRIESIVGYVEDEVDTGRMVLNRRKRWRIEDVSMDVASRFETIQPCGNGCPARHFCSRANLPE